MTPFEQFYSRYPRKEAKRDAEKAWRQVQGDRHADAILAALDWQVPLLLQRERQYRKLPATWLRAGCWEDENPAHEVQAKQAVTQAADEEYKAMRARVQAEQEQRWRKQVEGANG